MDRKEFLKSLGISGAAIMATYCLGGLQGCASKKDATPTAATNVDFTLDLSQAANAVLNTNGGWLVQNQIVIARTITGSYVAVTQVCSHEGNLRVVYDSVNNNFNCDVHGAVYNLNGTGKAGNAFATGGLKVYQTQLTGTTLRVFS